ncbi:MAG: hypothetical protein Q4F56_02860 [Candidatus Saccharibacteria bacterium]|nr:hypothetical protein [Candidatus Saccharibacteria bacterium]
MKLKPIKLIALLLASFVGLGILSSAPVFAIDDVCSSKASKEVKAAAGCPQYATKGELPNVIINIINGVIAVVGIIAVIFVIIGGIQYMTSSGDAGKIKKAKDTILYALIGLIVCVLSYAIVNFVIVKIIG